MPLPFAAFESRWVGADPSGAGDGRKVEIMMTRPGIWALLTLTGRVRAQTADGRGHDALANQLLWMHLPDSSPALPDWQLHAWEKPHALLLCFPGDWVHNTLGSLRKQLSPDFETLLMGPHVALPVLQRPLEAEDRAWARALMAPTLCTEARQLLEGSRMAEFFFRKVLTETRGEELFCTRTRRLSMERVTRVREALLKDLENPPPLEELAQICGCHPQYLSRTFSETAGTTISLYLRRLRIDRAATLMGTGRMNASEAALEVGYRSLSHFSQAFRAEKNMTPSQWMRGQGKEGAQG